MAALARGLPRVCSVGRSATLCRAILMRAKIEETTNYAAFRTHTLCVAGLPK
jgi:hypothetical protein